GRVFYRANQLALNDLGLFSAPIDGSASPSALYAPAGGRVGTYLASADETVIVFQTLNTNNVATAIRRMPFAGGPDVLLSPTSFYLAPHLALLPDLSRVLFLANVPPNIAGDEQFYSLPM